jgi:hypothetical protein
MHPMRAIALMALGVASLAEVASSCSKTTATSGASSTSTTSASGAVSASIVETPSSEAPIASTSVSAAPSTSASVSASASTTAAPAPPPMRAEEWDGLIGRWTFEPTGELTCECNTASSSIYRKGFDAKDFDLRVEFRFMSQESSAGVLFRFRGDDFYTDATFYQFEWYTRGSHHDKRLSLMMKSPINNSPDRYWIQLVEPKYPEAPIDQWKSFRVRAVGDHLETWLDGELVFDKHDPTFVRKGRVGLHTFMPRKMQYRGFSVVSLDSAKP